MRIIVSNGNNKNYFAVFGLLLGAINWGIIWYPYRLLDQSGIDGVSASLFTYLVASIIVSLFFLQHLKQFLTQPLRTLSLLLAAGWTNLSYVLAMIDGEVMRVLLLFYLSPVWTLLLAHFWLKEHVHIKGLIVILCSLLGAVVMLYDASQPTMLPVPRNTSEWLGLSSGLGFALANVISRKSSHLTLAEKTLAACYGVMLLSLLFLLLPQATLPSQLTIQHWQLIVFVGFMLFASNLAVQYGVTHVPAIPASTIFLFELVVAAIAAYYLANEAMVLNEWVGGALIVIASLYFAFSQKA